MNFTQLASFIIFRVVLPILLFGIQWMLYRRTSRWLKTSHPKQRWALICARLLFVVFNALALFSIIFRPNMLHSPQWLISVIVYPFYFWHGATFIIGLVLLCLMLIQLPLNAALWFAKKLPASGRKIEQIRSTATFHEFDAGRRIFLRRSMIGLATVSFGGNAYGLLVEKPSHTITDVTFPIHNLDPALSGFTIGLISDIHSSVFMTKKEMEEYVRLMNGLQTDLIVVDGDFVNSMVSEVYPFVEAFAGLRAPLGVYGVMGNHDFYSEDPELIAREVDGAGIRLLRNDKTIIRKNGGQFYLIGVDDVGRTNTAPIKLKTAIGYSPLAVPRILMCHRPYYLPEAAQRNIDLVLSGHTHGGQVVLGKIGGTLITPASLASPYISGKYHLGKTSMYVSRGIGTVGLPIRINCPPEITKITLTRAEPGADQTPRS